ncbi:MAG: hypothetical protein IH998_05905 [Proteobacteria bacterium]|nr:hypothetical protein [Pseudomonadota bacterium]
MKTLLRLALVRLALAVLALLAPAAASARPGESYSYYAIGNLAAARSGPTAPALMLVGGTLFIRIERTRTVARIVTSLLFALLAFSLVYACLNPRIGMLPI